MIAIGPSVFDNVFVCHGGGSCSSDYNDEAADATTADVPCTKDPVVAEDALYIGHLYNRFCRIVYKVNASYVSDVNFDLEYYDGAAWSIVPGTTSDDMYFLTHASIRYIGGFTGDTYPLTIADFWDKWTKVAVNGVTAYWMRFKVTNAHSGVVPKVDYIKPYMTFRDPYESSCHQEFAGALHKFADASQQLDTIAWKDRRRFAWDIFTYDDSKSFEELCDQSNLYVITDWVETISDTYALDVESVEINARPGTDPVRYDAEFELIEQ
jgi:hypothetical protein